MASTKMKKNGGAKTSTSTKPHAEAPVTEPLATSEVVEASAVDAGGDAAAADGGGVVLTPEQKFDAYAALAKVKPRALALRADEVDPYRVLPAVAMVNVRTMKLGTARFRDQMAEAFPKLDLSRYDGLDQTALALVAAASDAEKVTVDRLVVQKLARAAELRARMMPVLHGLAMNGHVPMAHYEEIAAGRGSRDVAKDCVDIPAAFTKYAAKVTGKHAIPDEVLAEATEVGSWLLLNLSTKGKKVPKAVPAEAIDLRNRVATLLTRDYEMCTIIAHYFLGDAYTEVAAPLRSRFVPRRAAAAPTDPTSPPTPTPTPTTPPVVSPAPVAPAPAAPPAPAATPVGAAPSNGVAPAMTSA